MAPYRNRKGSSVYAVLFVGFWALVIFVALHFILKVW